MSLLGLDCTDKIVINGVDLVNQDELSQGQLRELQRFIDENSHILKFMERPLEEPKESRFTKSPTPSRYGTIRSRIGYPADVNDGYQTLSQKFGLPNRDREIDYERTETYHRAPKLDFDMNQWNRTYGKQSNVNLSIENLHVGAPPGGWESLSSGRPSPYSTIDRKGSLRRSVGPSDKRVTIDPNYRSSSVDRPTERAMQNMKTNTTESNQIVHQAYNQGTQSLGRNAPRDSVYSTPFDPSKVAREGITGRDASYYSSVVSGLDQPEVTRTSTNYKTNSYGSTNNLPNQTMMRETNYGTNRSNHSTSTVNRGSGAYDKVYEPPSSGYNTTHSTNYTTIKNLPSSDYNSGHNSGHSTVKTIYTTGATPPPAPVLNPDRIFNAGNSDNVFTSMRYEKGPRDITTISSTVHLQPGENPQKKLDEIYKSLMQIR